MEYQIPENSYIIAHLFDYEGKDYYVEISEDLIDDIVSAVQGQYFVACAEKDFKFDGSQFKKVDIFAVDKNEYDRIKGTLR